jgi:hypothetical protein
MSRIDPRDLPSVGPPASGNPIVLPNTSLVPSAPSFPYPSLRRPHPRGAVVELT